MVEVSVIVGRKIERRLINCHGGPEATCTTCGGSGLVKVSQQARAGTLKTEQERSEGGRWVKIAEGTPEEVAEAFTAAAKRCPDCEREGRNTGAGD